MNKSMWILGMLAAIAASAVRAEESAGWKPLFADDLSNAKFSAGVWTSTGGELTASKDEAIWTVAQHENFELDLEFKTDHESNSGVILYCSDTGNWIPNSLEIQIADDHAEKWAQSPKTWQCGAAFGHLAPVKSLVKKPGEWNRYTITANGSLVDVVLNGEKVLSMDLRQWTSAKKNPDGTEIPPWLSRPKAELATKGFIGLQGKHGASSIWFRNVRIRQLQ